MAKRTSVTSTELGTEEETKVSLEKYVGKNKLLGFGNFRVNTSQVANVLLVGRSQTSLLTGKTSLLTTLEDPHQSVKTTGYSGTKKPQFISLIVKDSKENKWYQLNIFDTPGLHEERIDPNEKRDDDALLQLTQFCVENQVTHLNMICFVSVAGETALQDLKVFNAIKKYLGEECGKASSIIFTKCDKKSPDDLKSLQRMLKVDEETSNFAKFCELGFDYFGAINIEQCEALSNKDKDLLKEVLRKKLELIQQWRDQLLSKILKSSKAKFELKALSKIWDECENAEQEAVNRVIGDFTERLEKQNSRLNRSKNLKIEKESAFQMSILKFLDEKDQTLGFGRFEVQRARRINVLLVGRSQVGKSTIVQTLKNPHFTLRSTGYSKTRNSNMNTMILGDEKTKRFYQLNVVDTPGLGERVHKGQSRSDEAIIDVVKVFLKHQITKLNVIIFVSKAGETSMLDIGVFKELMDFLGPDSSAISMMLLTHCDEWVDEKLDEFEKNIAEHPESKDLVAHCKLGIQRLGTVNITEIKATAGSDEKMVGRMVQSQLLRVEKLRDAFLSAIISCENELHLDELDDSIQRLDSYVKEALRK